jgi:sugar phosphate isomerase/epimerase
VVAQVDAALAELGGRADRLGVTIAFRSDLASLAALERALSAAACPWFGIDLDPVALLRDEWTADEAFSRLGTLVRHVRGRDAVLGADRRTRPAVIGQGSTNWGELLADLDSAGYRGWITIDPLELPDRARAAGAGASYLRGVR